MIDPMPPKNNKNFPPVAKLTLVSVTGLTAVISTQGTLPGRVGKNRGLSITSALTTYTIYWGDGTTESAAGTPPTTLTHTYPNPTGPVTVQLIVTAANTLTDLETLTFSLDSPPIPPDPPPAVPPPVVSLTRMDESPTQAALF